MSYVATIVVPLLRQVDEWLDQSVRSALAQSVATEVIVVRSELTPASNLRVLDRLARSYPNLVVMLEDPPGSFPGAIDKGIRAARADRVGLLLSDDWLERDRGRGERARVRRYRLERTRRLLPRRPRERGVQQARVDEGVPRLPDH